MAIQSEYSIHAPPVEDERQRVVWLAFRLMEGEDSSVLLEKLRHAVGDIVPGRKVLGADCAEFRLRALLSGEWGKNDGGMLGRCSGPYICHIDRAGR